MNEIVVGRITSGEFVAAAEVIVRAREAAVPAIPRSIHPPEDMVIHFSTVVFPSAATWVARSSGDVLGVLVSNPGWVDHLYVAPEHTGKGIGTLLLEAAMAQAETLDLWTFESNLAARRFYERHGFVVVDRTDGDNEEGAPDVRYRWCGPSLQPDAQLRDGPGIHDDQPPRPFVIIRIDPWTIEPSATVKGFEPDRASADREVARLNALGKGQYEARIARGIESVEVNGFAWRRKA